MDNIVRLKLLNGHWSTEIYPWIKINIGPVDVDWEPYNPEKDAFYYRIRMHNKNKMFLLWLVWG